MPALPRFAIRVDHRDPVITPLVEDAAEGAQAPDRGLCTLGQALFLPHAAESVNALTEADEPRIRRPSKLTKVAVAG